MICARPDFCRDFHASGGFQLANKCGFKYAIGAGQVAYNMKKKQILKEKGGLKKKAGTVIRFLVLFGMALLIVVLVRIFAAHNKVQGLEVQAPLVKVERASLRNISRSLTLSGYIEAKAMIPVIPLVSGTVIDYPVEVGQSVREGDVIARIDSEPFDQQVVQARAAYLAYENSFKRIQNLYQGGNATEQNYDQTKAARDSAKAQYDLALLQKSYATVRSKSSGTVITTMSAKGSTAAQGQPLAVVADLNSLIVNLKIPEKYYSIIERNKADVTVLVRRPESDEVCSALVGPVDPYVNPQSKTFNMECRLENAADVLFRPGMFVKVSLVYDTHQQVPAMPQSIRKTDGSFYVLEDGKAVHCSLVPEIEDSEFFMIGQEFLEKDFIVEGQNSVFDGQTVRLD